MDANPVLVSHPAVGIVRLTLNRPKALNAISVDLLDGLTASLREHGSARVIILEGAGDRSFCAGEDLKQTLAPKTGSAEELREAFQKLQDITRLTSSASAIVVAAVQGYAIGGGAEIALAADFVIGGPNAQFKFPEATIGHAVTGGISLRLVPMVGLLKAKQLLMLGNFTGAEEALSIGLLTEIAEDPKQRALELALELATRPGIAATNSKTSLERAVFPNMENVLHDEVNVASYCFAQSAAADAFSNFASRKVTLTKTNGAHEAIKSGGFSRNATEEIVAKLRAVKDINTAFKNALDTMPDRTFLRFGGHDLSFKEFDVSVSALAGGLRERGVGPGDRVLVMMRNSVEMVHTWIATNRLGATWVPVNVELKSVTLQHVVQAADPKLAIVDAEFFQDIQLTNVLKQEDIYVQGGTDPHSLTDLYDFDKAISEAVEVAPSTTSAFLYTSGTTGRSKPCVLSHSYFIHQASLLIESFGIHGEDVLYCPFPLFHADATALTVIPAILLGAVAALSTRFSASRFWDEIRATRATVYDFMGATLALTYKQPASPKDLDHSVRLAWGVPIPSFAEDYERRFGHPLYTLYGSVEASLPITQRGARVPGSCGTINKGFQIRIADENDEPVLNGTAGQLLLRSDYPGAFFDGYFNNHAANEAAFKNLWLHSGDLASIDDDGNVYFVGRLKDVIRRRGENINAADLEEEFLRHPAVKTAAAFAIPSTLGSGTEDDVKVAIQLCEGAEVDETALWAWSTENMARFQVPSVIEIVQEIKKTPTGKLDKSTLSPEGGQRFDIRSIRG
ncbi:coenzyme A synthetase, putative [Talaromyces stipitatus ATCC 10500]|uniref:Coenzyme A synthetase, putative n=1 Tax=Talaromyces stipitatus (strain ATCC 10500 / CBS 375.48 / QM 6759 / NRRL 1006) TaxID=441959 RepID=B8M131_TALSN|nr:coenzyme A synthetase, putative [Talaromyces stipitatus ATCC 10500]EED20973.1 coenzyme A synthetase, putative [Talaromyces stipitatus ATCC 10500]